MTRAQYEKARESLRALKGLFQERLALGEQSFWHVEVEHFGPAAEVARMAPGWVRLAVTTRAHVNVDFWEPLIGDGPRGGLRAYATRPLEPEEYGPQLPELEAVA